MSHYPTLEEIEKADELQIAKWHEFLVPLSDDSDYFLRLEIIKRFFEIDISRRSKILIEIGDKCLHSNQFLKVIDACVTCETVVRICHDCRKVLDTKTDC